MEKVIMIGADVHDRNIAIRKAIGRGASVRETVLNSPTALHCMVTRLWQEAHKARCKRIVIAYEASAAGYGLYDFLVAHGIECYVLAPTKIVSSSHERKRKTDDRDAIKILQELRNHLLAGSELPAIWIPSARIRDDRELVRARLKLREKVSEIKNQIQCLLKRHRLCKPENIKSNWTQKHCRWIDGLCRSELPRGASVALTCLLRQYAMLEAEVKVLDEEIENLSRTPSYAAASEALVGMYGVGTLTAMVFLTELGDLTRFRNRRQIASYLGLAPSCHESGNQNDRKGHITHAGSSRVRKVLCQSIWARIRGDGPGSCEYASIHRGEKKRKKIAVVALMRRLAIRMWHRAVDAQQIVTSEIAA